MVNSLLTTAAEIFLPQTCALCGLRSHRPLPLCRDCEREMPVNQYCCVRCAIPLPVTSTASTSAFNCGACQHTPPPFDHVIAPWLYDDYFAHLIHRWKYRREQRMTTLLAELWRQRVELPTDINVLIPVPLHWRRRWQRGFNQSELLARRLLADCPELSSCTLAPRLVKRRRATASQLGMTAVQRVSNLHGAFTVCGPCDNLRIAIVDDVLTTGATAATMANALADAGASYIEIWCLARTPAPGD
jgi:ComF family protein